MAADLDFLGAAKKGKHNAQQYTRICSARALCTTGTCQDDHRLPDYVKSAQQYNSKMRGEWLLEGQMFSYPSMFKEKYGKKRDQLHKWLNDTFKMKLSDLETASLLFFFRILASSALDGQDPPIGAVDKAAIQKYTKLKDKLFVLNFCLVCKNCEHTMVAGVALTHKAIFYCGEGIDSMFAPGSRFTYDLHPHVDLPLSRVDVSTFPGFNRLHGALLRLTMQLSQIERVQRFGSRWINVFNILKHHCTSRQKNIVHGTCAILAYIANKESDWKYLLALHGIQFGMTSHKCSQLVFLPSWFSSTAIDDFQDITKELETYFYGTVETWSHVQAQLHRSVELLIAPKCIHCREKAATGVCSQYCCASCDMCSNHPQTHRVVPIVNMRSDFEKSIAVVHDPAVTIRTVTDQNSHLQHELDAREKELRKAREDLDKAIEDLHKAREEAQSWKQKAEELEPFRWMLGTGNSKKKGRHRAPAKNGPP